MAAYIYPENSLTQTFTGRLYANDKWHRIEISAAEALQVALPLGTAFGIGLRVRIFDELDRKEFWVMTDDAHIPNGGKAELDQLKLWLPKCGVMLAISVLAMNQQIPETGIFSVGASDYSTDPQRGDAQAFRRRCRFDVLNIIISCMNANPPEAICRHATIVSAVTYTRIYQQDDILDAIRYWTQKRYITMRNLEGDIDINQTLDDNMMEELLNYSWTETVSPNAKKTTNTQAAIPTHQYDVFLSHASEDKADVVIPLANELIKLGLRVWVDYIELRLGDRLRQRVDEGLSCSRYGVVIISPRFLAKQWPKAELDGLVALEMADGKKRILPVWHNVDHEEVTKQSPLLASRLAVKWNEGLSKVAAEILREVRA